MYENGWTLSLFCTAILEAAFEAGMNELGILFGDIHHTIYFLQSELWSLEYAFVVSRNKAKFKYINAACADVSHKDAPIYTTNPMHHHRRELA